MGCLMKNGIAAHPHHVCYVLRIDGRLSSKYRRLVEALRAGLQLKDQFPQHDVKVSVVQTRNSTAETVRETALHRSDLRLAH
jgi:hypothetical protein